MDDEKIDVLVDAITERVRARLNGQPSNAAVRSDGRKVHGAGCMSCQMPIEACEL